MRVSGNAVRLAALVAAATTSGYLWRAALEAPRRTTVIRLAPPATPDVHVIAAPHDPVSSRPAGADAGQRVAARPRTQPTARAVTRVAAPTRHVPPPTRPAAPPASSHPAPPPKPSPAPAPPPKPTQPPPPPTTSQPPPTASPPPVTATQQPPQSSPPPTDSGNDSGDSSRPGWGHGDKNHDHDGPPGGGKRG